MGESIFPILTALEKECVLGEKDNEKGKREREREQKVNYESNCMRGLS